jgi:ParB-like chromosome segregation protein Spo0J/DNA modification methylase
MKTLAISSLTIKPNRQRREFKLDSLNELGQSITANQLLQPPVIRFEDNTAVLVAGERRLRAMQDLHDLGVIFRHNNEEVPHGCIPYVDLGTLSETDAWEAELEENIRRVDLTWQERASATSSLMALRTAQARERGDIPPSTKQLTNELRPDQAPEQAHDSTRTELIVARFLDDAEVRAAPTIKEAFKILKKRETATQNAALAESVGRTFTSASHTLEQADFLLWQTTAKPAQFDIILTDPPYGMGADEFGDSGQGVGAAAHFYEDSYESWLALMQVFPAATFALAKASAHAYVFCDLDRFPELRTRMSEAGWKVHRTPLIWHNPDGFRAPWPTQGPQRKYELILYAVKGDKKVTAVQPDVLKYARDTNLGHPAQKPVALLIDLLRRSARPGDTVFDPCVGSGATIEACHELQLTCTGLEKDQAAYGIAVKRLQGLKALEEKLL